MSSGGHLRDSFIPRWNEEAATLEASSTKKEERNLCGPRLHPTFDPEGDTSRYVRDNLTDLQLEAADGSDAQMIVKIFRLYVRSKSSQGGVSLLLVSSRLDSLGRNW